MFTHFYPTNKITGKKTNKKLKLTICPWSLSNGLRYFENFMKHTKF